MRICRFYDNFLNYYTVVFVHQKFEACRTELWRPYKMKTNPEDVPKHVFYIMIIGTNRN